jgi:L-ascorbate metabolism protein UlaG (beta-lactamase superfamily)
MEITKLEHSGIVIEKDGERIVFDPVEFNKTIPRLNNVVAVIITHKHSDHLQIEVIKKIIRDNSDAKIITTSDAASFIEDSIIVKAGESYQIGGFKLDFFGKDHAAIIPGQIPCENIGVVVNGSIMNPGDSFDYSNIGAKVLFVPISAPWLKIAESMDFVDKVKPRIVIPVHDALLSDLGKSINDNWMKKACDKAGAEYRDLSFGENVVC